MVNCDLGNLNFRRPLRCLSVHPLLAEFRRQLKILSGDGWRAGELRFGISLLFGEHLSPLWNDTARGPVLNGVSARERFAPTSYHPKHTKTDYSSRQRVTRCRKTERPIPREAHSKDCNGQFIFFVKFYTTKLCKLTITNYRSDLFSYLFERSKHSCLILFKLFFNQNIYAEFVSFMINLQWFFLYFRRRGGGLKGWSR